MLLNAPQFSKRLLVGAVVLVGSMVPVSTAADVEQFELARAIPSDAYMAIHGREHSGLTFLNAQYERVWAKLESQRLDRELRRILKRTMTDSGAKTSEEFDTWWQDVNEMLASVQWSELFADEWAMAMRMGLPPEFLLLSKSDVETAKVNYGGMSDILSKMAEGNEGLSVTKLDAGSGASSDAPEMTMVTTGGTLPFRMTVSRYRDVLSVAIGDQLQEQSRALLTGEGGERLADTQVFRDAIKQLPQAEDGLFFMNMDRFMSQTRGMVQRVAAMGEMAGADDPNGPVAMVNKLIDFVDVMDYMAAVSSTDGMKTTSTLVAQMDPAARDKPFYRAIAGLKPLQRPLRHIPANANNMSAANTMDFVTLYRGIIDFIEKDVPNGAATVEMMEQQMAAFDLDIERDVLGWLDGRLVTFTLPGASSFAQDDWALMFGVKDAEKGRAMVDRLMTTLTPMLASQDGQVVDVEVEGATGFKSVQMPMLMVMATQPTIGVTDDYLYIASGANVVEASLKAASSGEDFSSNARFREEGLDLGRNVVAVSFTDTTKSGEEIGQALSMAPMMALAGGPAMQQNPVFNGMLRIAGRLGPVVAEMNFFLSTASQTTVDDATYRTVTVTNYREPPNAETASASN